MRGPGEGGDSSDEDERTPDRNISHPTPPGPNRSTGYDQDVVDGSGPGDFWTDAPVAPAPGAKLPDDGQGEEGEGEGEAMDADTGKNTEKNTGRRGRQQDSRASAGSRQSQRKPNGGRVTAGGPFFGDRSRHDRPGRSRTRRRQTPAPAPAGKHGPSLQDPVKSHWGGREDLYDIATWEKRSALDGVSVGLTNAYRRVSAWLHLLPRALLIFIAGLVFFLQILIAAAAVLQEPLLLVLTFFSVAPAGVLAGYIWYRDPTKREPIILLTATFLLSMVFAMFAAVVNSAMAPLFGAAGVIGLIVYFFVIVGPVEEFVKWYAIKIYAYKSDMFKTVMDGAVYGAVAGLGFATIENFIYILNFYTEADAGDQLLMGTLGAGVRAFAGPGHIIFSAWAGFYLGLAKFNPDNWGPIVLKGILIATFIHALYNTMVTVLAFTGIFLFGLIIIYHGFWFVLLYRKIRKYRSLYKDIDRQSRKPAQRNLR